LTPERFREWLAAMQAAGLATSDAHCGRLLGVSANSVVQMKARGADRRTALACAALMQGVAAW